MSWSPQQEDALKAVSRWVKHGDEQVFRLFGYAGTGKSTLAKEIAEKVDDPMYGAFTGKAAQVMRRKGCKDAQTIHSMIYRLEDGDKEEPTFVLNEESDVAKADLVIIDECSMIDEIMGKDLLSFGTKILVLGDPAQLPPVKGAGFFTSAAPDYMLTEVHRQARDNPIIEMSMKIRQGERLELGTYGESRVIQRKQITPGEILATDQVIVGMNKSRQQYNRRMRELLHLQPETPVKSDKLICLRNDRQKGIFNGGMWEIISVKKKRTQRGTYKIHVRSLDDDRATPTQKTVEVLPQFFEGTEADLPWQAKRGTQEFTFGYAITCHKAQGSQWNNAIVFDESATFRDDSQRWLYTAVTRAAETLTLVTY